MLDGTFFFKPQAESGSHVLSPNRGTSYDSTLWGFNWMHDGTPVDGGVGAKLGEFLKRPGLYWSDRFANTCIRPRPEQPAGPCVYIVDPPPPDGLQNPEPATLMIWGLLVVLSAVVYCRRRS